MKVHSTNKCRATISITTKATKKESSKTNAAAVAKCHNHKTLPSFKTDAQKQWKTKSTKPTNKDNKKKEDSSMLK